MINFNLKTTEMEGCMRYPSFRPFVPLSIHPSSMRCPFCRLLPISYSNVAQIRPMRGLICRTPFPGQYVKRSRSHGSFKILLQSWGYLSRSAVCNFYYFFVVTLPFLQKVEADDKSPLLEMFCQAASYYLPELLMTCLCVSGSQWVKHTENRLWQMLPTGIRSSLVPSKASLFFQEGHQGHWRSSEVLTCRCQLSALSAMSPLNWTDTLTHWPLGYMIVILN